MLHARLAKELFEIGDAPGAEDQVDLALATLSTDVNAASRATVLADVGRLMMLMVRFDEALTLCEQAVTLAPADVAPRSRARALTTMGTILGETGRVAEALPLFAEAKQVATASADGYELGRYYGNLAIVLDGDGQRERAREVSLEGIGAMARFGLERSTGANLRHNLAVDELWAGRPSEARPLLLENIAQGAVSAEAATDQVVLGAVENLLGDLGAAGAAFSQARTMLRRGGRIDAEADLLWNMAISAAWLGELDDARTHIYAGLHLARPADHEFRLLMTATGLWIEADAAQNGRRSGDDAAVAAAVDAAEALALDADGIRAAANAGDGRWSNRAEAGSALCVPELRRAQGDDDPVRWAEATVAIAASKVPHLEAYARWRRAEALAGHEVAKQELEDAIRSGVVMAKGVHEPVRRRLVALATAHGIDLDEPAMA